MLNKFVVVVVVVLLKTRKAVLKITCHAYIIKFLYLTLSSPGGRIPPPQVVFCA